MSGSFKNIWKEKQTNLNLTFSAKKFYLVSYDIVDNRRRSRVMKLLKGSGFHVQKSVFECHLSLRQVERLVKLLYRRIDPETDSVRIYELCERCVPEIRVIGVGEVSAPPLVKII